MEAGTSDRRRRRLAAMSVPLAVAMFLAATTWSSNSLRDRASSLNLGMTEAEVVAIMGPPNAAWSVWPPYRVTAFGKGTHLRDSASNLWLDITGRAQVHPANANWPVRVTFDDHDLVVGVERHGEKLGPSPQLEAIGGGTIIPVRGNRGIK